MFLNPAMFLAWAVVLLFATTQQVAFTYSARSLGAAKILWLGGGCASFLIETAAWMWLLTFVPLGIATPMLGASYITVAMASRWLFKETIDKSRWAGIALILLGLALIGREQG